jgi:homoserine dehydrogenase
MDPEINCVVEVMGGVDIARDVVLRALRGGKHVITANKVLRLLQRYRVAVPPTVSALCQYVINENLKSKVCLACM